MAREYLTSQAPNKERLFPPCLERAGFPEAEIL